MKRIYIVVFGVIALSGAILGLINWHKIEPASKKEQLSYFKTDLKRLPVRAPAKAEPLRFRTSNHPIEFVGFAVTKPTSISFSGEGHSVSINLKDGTVDFHGRTPTESAETFWRAVMLMYPNICEARK